MKNLNGAALRTAGGTILMMMVVEWRLGFKSSVGLQLSNPKDRDFFRDDESPTALGGSRFDWGASDGMNVRWAPFSFDSLRNCMNLSSTCRCTACMLTTLL